MSNFNCQKCGKPILEDEGGKYITGCEHYPAEQPLCECGRRASNHVSTEGGCLEYRSRASELKRLWPDYFGDDPAAQGDAMSPEMSLAKYYWTVIRIEQDLSPSETLIAFAQSENEKLKSALSDLVAAGGEVIGQWHHFQAHDDDGSIEALGDKLDVAISAAKAAIGE